ASAAASTAAKPATGSGSAAASPAASAKPSGQAGGAKVRAAFVYLGTANDHGWTQAHDDGRKKLEAALGDKVETAFTENVPEAAESQRVIEDYARKGFDIIYTTSFGYMDFTLAAAKNFPNVKFEHCSGFKTAANMGTYMGDQADARYVCGLLAGKMTKSNTLGFIGSFPTPEVIRDMNGFARGVLAANPQAKIRMTWINTWYDPAKETSAANALLDTGADVLASVTDSPAMAQAAAAKKKYSVGSDTDQTSYAPDFMLASAYWDWSVHYIKSVQSVLDGTWKPSTPFYHMKDGVSLVTAPNSKVVPADAAKVASDAVDQLKAGKNVEVIWSGLIKDNKGNVIVPEGKVLGDAFKGTPLPGQTTTDGYLQSEQMNWANENVLGDIPKS
ncbi:MAG TPA: BMP family ABC transporter substrate-binding protein, partial [Chloroflexota bacterium]|nr:BMP family ABC transporter substrate-binding protein [Chloroflexota bacterium]